MKPICALEPILVSPSIVEQLDRTKVWDSMKDQGKGAIYANNLFWFGLFMLQHTGMKKLGFKNNIFPVSARLERPLYCFAAAFTFHMCFYMQCPLPEVIYEVKDLNLMWFIGVFNFFGTMFCLASTFILDHWSFMGITQAHAREPENLPFGRTGMYGIMRHPQYFGQLIAFWSRSRMTEGDLLYSVSMTLYILIAVRYSEEPALIKLIGEDYITYTEEVPAYCPLRLPGMFCPQPRSKKVLKSKG